MLRHQPNSQGSVNLIQDCIDLLIMEVESAGVLRRGPEEDTSKSLDPIEATSDQMANREVTAGTECEQSANGFQTLITVKGQMIKLKMKLEPLV